MNILSLIHIHRLPNPSGVGRVIDQLLMNHATHFPAARHRMLVDKKLYDRVYHELGIYWKKASFIPYSSGVSWQQAKWVGLNKPQAEAYWKEVDVMYCPAESYTPTTQAKLVCTIHDVAGFEPGLYPNGLSRRMHCLKWRVLFQRMALYADAVVTVSAFSASRIAHYFPQLTDKLRVIHNAPHAIFGSEIDPLMSQKIEQVCGTSPFIFLPGGLSLRKNADLILKTVPLLAREFPDVKLIVAGSCEADYLNKLTALDSKNVMVLGYVSDALLNALYQRATVVWFPSRYEGFGMPAVEAMASGAPVVASRVASIPEVVNDAALLCAVDSPHEHIEALRSLISSSTFRSEMSARGRTQAQKFTWEASAIALEHLFQSLDKS